MIAAAILVWILWPVVLAISVLLLALYAGTETGVYVLNDLRLDLRAEAGHRPARIIRGLLRRPDNLLAVLLVGTNIAAYAATFAVSTMFVLAGHKHRAEWYTLAVATPALFVLGESIPKNLFRRMAETLVYRLAWFLKGSSILFNVCLLAPVVQGISLLLTHLAGRGRRAGQAAEHSIVAAALSEGQASGLVTQFQPSMAERVMTIEDVQVADVMVPMSRAATVDARADREELIARIREHEYSRLPMRDDDGQVAGIVDVYDVLTEPGAAPADKRAEPTVLGVDLPVTEALYRMQEAHCLLAVAVDAAGRHVGIVSIKDLVAEIVGEMEEL